MLSRPRSGRASRFMSRATFTAWKMLSVPPDVNWPAAPSGALKRSRPIWMTSSSIAPTLGKEPCPERAFSTE